MWLASANAVRRLWEVGVRDPRARHGPRARITRGNAVHVPSRELGGANGDVDLGQGPDVSVLIPVLNEAAHIRETVAALQAQTGELAIELLFVDGASEDDTRRILEELARNDPHITVL